MIRNSLLTFQTTDNRQTTVQHDTQEALADERCFPTLCPKYLSIVTRLMRKARQSNPGARRPSQ